MESQTTVLNSVDGSAMLIYGETRTVVSVAGPIEPKPRQELPTTSALEVIVRADVGVSDTREKLLEDKLRSVLSQAILGQVYPRQLIQVVAQVLESGEDDSYTCKEVASILNGAYLALIDANVSLKYSFAAESFSIAQDGEIIANPTPLDLKQSKSSHVVCYAIQDAKARDLLFSDSIGTFTEQELYKVLAHAVDSVENHHQHFRKTIQRKIEKDFVWQL
jgi:exosome complex component RRP46